MFVVIYKAEQNWISLLHTHTRDKKKSHNIWTKFNILFWVSFYPCGPWTTGWTCLTIYKLKNLNNKKSNTLINTWANEMNSSQKQNTGQWGGLAGRGACIQVWQHYDNTTKWQEINWIPTTSSGTVAVTNTCTQNKPEIQTAINIKNIQPQ